MTEDKQMSLVEHLDELRRRAILALISVFAGMLVGWCSYHLVIFDLLCSPAADIGIDLHFIDPPEAFWMRVRASFFAGLILASPFVSYQIWRFVSVGLTARERRAMRVFLPASVALFLGGVLMAYLIVLPVILRFLVLVAGRGLVPMITFSKHVSLVVMCCLAFGLVFEMPLVILFLTRLGIVSPTFLIQKRRYAILMMFVVGAMLTPPDVISQIMLAVPMIVLYEVSIVLSKIAWARRKKRKAQRLEDRNND